jgi:D-serine deaminase-like pyridoxal phosphate-dependent protein
MEMKRQTQPSANLDVILAGVVKPTLLLDRSRVLVNIDAMARKAATHGIRFRPHFKTHQSAGIGDWFRSVGVDAITVSSVAMATYFADHGWRDITIAFPVNLREIDQIDALAGRIDLHLLADAPVAIDFLSASLTHGANLWIEVDSGYRRSGVAWDDEQTLDALADSLSRAGRLHLRGVLAHAGNTYGARSLAEVRAIHDETVARMAHARALLQTMTGDAALEISIGDTPACSMLDSLPGVDEMRPGNFVFYDLMQLQIGACAEADIGVAVACPVVAKYPARRELVLYGGAIHLSKDALARPDGGADFGHVALFGPDGWGPSLPGVHLRSLSQEHGIVAVDSGVWAEVDRSVNIGDLVAVLPVHSCLTANLLRRYQTLDGEVIAMAPVL